MIVNGVSIIFGGPAPDHVGMSITWISFVESDHVMMSLPKEASATERLLEGERFTVSALSATQLAVARSYGGRKVRTNEDIQAVDVEGRRWGMPVIRNSLTDLLCLRCHVNDIRQQTIVIGTVIERVQNSSDPPLLYRHADYF